MLKQARLALAGTYFAEQVDQSSYDLVCASHAEKHSRPTTQQSSAGSTSGQQAPGSASGKRRTHQNQAFSKCTFLPALLNLDPLLDSMDGVGTVTPSLSVHDPKKDLQEKRAHHIGRTAARLFRGEAIYTRRRRGDTCGTPSDGEILASLTQPLACFGPLETRRQDVPRLGNRKRPKQHSTYHEAVQAGLARTDYCGKSSRMRQKAPLGLQLNPPTKIYQEASTSTLRSCGSVRSLTTTEVPVLPVDAVEAYFKTEMEKRIEADQKAVYDVDSVDSVCRDGKRRVSGLTTSETDSSEVQMSKERVQSSVHPLNETAILGAKPRRLPSKLASSINFDPAAIPEMTKAETNNDVLAKDPSRDAGKELPSQHDLDVDLSTAAAADGAALPVTQEDVDPHASILNGLSPLQKISQSRREASQSLRLFVFGDIGGENKKSGNSSKDVDRAIRERIGTKPQVLSLYALWDKLDDDGSGSVDMAEFRQFVDKAIKTIGDMKFLAGTRMLEGLGFSLAYFETGTAEENRKFASKMCDRIGASLLGKKTTFVLEDMMRIIWPCSQNSDLKQMKRWCQEHAMNTWRAPTPRKLAKDEFDALTAVFRYFDNDSSGSVTIEELIQSGLVDKEQACKYLSEVDGPDGDGEISMLEFCELFCPTGFRAHSRAKVGTDETGRRLVFDERLDGWRLEEVNPGSLFA